MAVVVVRRRQGWRRSAAADEDEFAQPCPACFDNEDDATVAGQMRGMWSDLLPRMGCANVQFNLGVTYENGQGVKQDTIEAAKWYQLAAEQGHAGALKYLADLQQRNRIPAPPPGTAVTTILLTSAAGSKYLAW